jgi:ubiquitin-conjugating enzyme E2 D/E
MTTNASLRRLRIDYDDMRRSPFFTELYAQPVSDGDEFVRQWEGLIIGPPGTPYEGGVFRMRMSFPDNYPFSPPVVRILTRILHPCVDDFGRCNFPVFLPELRNPSVSVLAMLRMVQSDLESSTCDCPLRPEIADLMRTDPVTFERRAREMTEKFSERVGAMTVREALSFSLAVRECHPLAISCDVQREMYLFATQERSPEVQQFVDSL